MITAYEVSKNPGAVHNDQLDRLEVRDDAGDVTEVGATG